MIRAHLTFSFLLLAFSTLIAQYSVSTIPPELMENVDVVVREDVMKWNITAPDRATKSVLYAVTILNANGNDHAEVVVGYDKLEKINGLKVTVYGAGGDVLRKVKNNEIRDISAFDGFSLYSDNRLRYVDVSQATYPYTVEIQYELEFKYLYHNQGSAVLHSPRTSSQHFLYEITYKPELAPRYRQRNFDTAPRQIRNADGTETLTWEAANVKAIKTEPAGPSFSEIRPAVFAVPSVFSFSGYAGKMNSWDDYNAWILSLNKGRDVIPDATRQKVADLTRNLKTTEEKSRALYEYLQGKTRYVSIQLGIGGFQPFEAQVVDEVGYGDCKALSNYMVSLLNAAGVKGYYTLIRAGADREEMMIDFPSSQFNHAIVAVPNGPDTLWLECTSQTNPFGYQGTFTGNRKALMITEAGGKIVNTASYPAEVNVRNRFASVDLQVTGDARASVTTTYRGLRYESGNLDYYLNQPQDDQRKWLLENIRIPNFNVDKFKLVNHKGMTPAADVEIGLTLNRYASVSGKRMFVVPNLMSRSSFVPEAVSSRKSNVVIKTGFIDRDSIVFSVPENIYPEFVPQAIKHESNFGTYEATFNLDQGKLIYTRSLVVKEGTFPPESYQEYVDFYRNVSKADNLKIVFLSKT
jgi:transglutaminase-like putative cysteine protease